MRYLLILFVVIFFTACKTSNIFVQPRAEQKSDVELLDSVFRYNPDYQYVIRKDDKINISVWEQDDFSVGSIYGIYNSNEVYGKWLMVDPKGNIEVPKLGTMHVLGMTEIELKTRLKEAFATWLVNPIVDIKVLNKVITVMGEVRTPQMLKVDKDRNTLLEMIARCEGFVFYADLRCIKVLRQIGEDVIVANINITKSGDYLSKNIQLHPGDIVIVPSKKYKEFDKRISTIIPFTTTISAAAILMGLF